MTFFAPTDNTFKMEPDVKFQPKKVERVIKAILEEELKDESYSARESPNICKSLTVKIRKAVKDLNFPRYRIIAYVTIGQRRQQCFQSVSQWLWDDKKDDFASVSYENESLFAIATVYGVYFE